MDKIKRLDEQLKSRIAESKLARGKVNYKSAEDVQHEIDRLQKQVDSGSMKIVDEKKALGEISQLNRIKKSFAGFEESQKGIDEIKAQIAEQKKLLDDPESRALSDRYTQITTELDQIKAEQDEVFKNLNSLRDERTRLHEDQQKKYTAVKEIKDAYYSQRREAVKYEQEARRIREEKRRAENEAYHRGRRQEAAKAKLEEASGPAYQDEIRTTQSLLAYFDPSSAPKQTVAGPGKFAATNFRTVDDSGFKGTRVSKKDEDEENYFVGGGGKKNKRNRGQASTTPTTTTDSKFNLDLGTIGSLAQIDVNPPMSQADVPALVEQLKEKLAFWKGDQERKTQEVSLRISGVLTCAIAKFPCRTLQRQRPRLNAWKRRPLPPRTRMLKRRANLRRTVARTPLPPWLLTSRKPRLKVAHEHMKRREIAYSIYGS